MTETVHDKRMAQASACRGCGVQTTDAERVADWRVCRRCSPIFATNSHGLLWQMVLGDKTITDDEGAMLTNAVNYNPAFFRRNDPETFWSQGQRKPWEHVGAKVRDDAKSALRRHRDNTKVRRHPHGPCCLCGVAQDAGWTIPASEGKPVCSACEPLMRKYGWPRSGSLDADSRANCVTVLALGLRPDAMHTTIGKAVPVMAYGEFQPDGPGGDEPWSHVPAADRREARVRLGMGSSKIAQMLTDDERAEIARRREQAAMEWAARPVEPAQPIRLP